MVLAKFVETIVVVQLPSFSLINNKIGSVLVTQHCSMFAMEMQQCILFVLLRYMSLLTI